MTNLEGIARRLMEKGSTDSEIIDRLIEEYRTFKNEPREILLLKAGAVLDEVKKSQNAISKLEDAGKNNALPESLIDVLKDVVEKTQSGITMGVGGVGCRGRGDFYVHKKLSLLSKTTVAPYISPESLDDTGAVELSTEIIGKDKGESSSVIILTKMEGMHSRLSDFPFLAGFHVTRAALRDIYVKGGIPLSIIVDVHLADDGDIGALFDFQSGIATVAELSGVPITAGSTLRIGGDMVIGDRLTGGIGAIGYMKHSFFRKNIKKDDVVIMTEGAGGGTISTTALYSGEVMAVLETLNVKFLKAARKILDDDELSTRIHCMADVTNGGLRGDLYEINYESGLGVKIYPHKVKELVNPHIMELLEKTGVDYLGVSLDALLIYCEKDYAKRIIAALKSIGVKSGIIGHVTEDRRVTFVSEDGEEKIIPRFRESAYTELKKVVGIDANTDEKDIYRKIDEAYGKSLEKRRRIVKYILENQGNNGDMGND